MSRLSNIAIFHNLPSGGAKRALHGFVKFLYKNNMAIELFIPSTANEEFLNLKKYSKLTHVLKIPRTLKGKIISSIKYVPSIKNNDFSLADLEICQKKIAELINLSNTDAVIIEQDQYTMSPFVLKYIKKYHLYFCQQPTRINEPIINKIKLESGAKEKYQGLFFTPIWRKFLRKKLMEIDRNNAIYAKYILANSFFSQKSIKNAYGLTSHVCYLGIDPETFRPLKISRQNFILTVGSLTPAKGFDFIINSIGKIVNNIRPELVIVYNSLDNTWKKYIVELANKKEVKITLKYLIGDNELVELYNSAKIVVYAPYLEPFGFVPLESLACQTPVVAVNEGGIRETVTHNVTGLLTERDENQFAQAITRLLLDPKKRTELANHGFDTVKGFWTTEFAGERLLKHLNSILQ